MRNTFFSAFVAILMLFPCSGWAKVDESIFEGLTPDEIEFLKADTFCGKIGTIVLKNCNARIKVPKGYQFLFQKEAKHLLCDYWNNPSDRTLGVFGVLVPRDIHAFYEVEDVYVVTYSNCGYISDEDVNNTDYDELATALRKESEEEGAKLPKEQRLIFTGWASTPKYDKKLNVAFWAKKYSSVNGDVLNYDIHILGKEGEVTIKAVADLSSLSNIQAQENEFISCLSFDEGYRYGDFVEGKDKKSDYTVGGLIAGGVLAKTGLLAKIGLFLAKAWKFIAVAVACGVGAIFKRKKNKPED